MANLLLFIQEEQVHAVMEKADIGTGQTSFRGMAKPGNRIFVASNFRGELCVVGEGEVAETYEEESHPEGWKYRARFEGGAIPYEVPVPLKDFKEKLSILRHSDIVSNAIRFCRWLTEEDAELLSLLGRRSVR